MKTLVPLSLGLLAVALSPVSAAAAELAPSLTVKPPAALAAAGIPRRLLAIDNVCAWPNLVTLKDGSFVALVFNQPNHGYTEGDVDCWGSADGRFWNRLSTVTQHASQTVRMNHAAGLNAAGELVVLTNGWDDIAPRRNPKSRTIQTVVSISRDGGKSWTQGGFVMPAVPGFSWHVPFGDIQLAANGDLIAGTYAFTFDPTARGHREGHVYAARSRDGGRTWSEFAPVVKDQHCEGAIVHLGGGRWLNAARRFRDRDLDVFASDDDAMTWRHVGVLDVTPVSSAHLLKLSDGRVLLTYGNRAEGNRGIDARSSRDGGKTWSSPQRLIALDTGDCGYPDAVELPGGHVMVAYYADGIAQHQRYHMGVLNLTLAEIR
jgi:Neuraminidase (sialidase)